MCIFKRNPSDSELLALPQPKELAKITHLEMYDILRPVFGNIGHIYVGDATLSLADINDYLPFLKLFKPTLDYTTDNYDCEKIAWEMRCKGLIFTRGKFPFGYVIGYADEEDYSFGPHGWNFVVDHKKQVWFCDYLEVAGPKEEFMPVMPVHIEDVLT